jgi:hypothetical protein
MNHMIHIAAMSQIRLDTDGRAYYRRKASRGQEATRGDPVPQAQDLRRDLPPAHRGRTTGHRRRSWYGSGRALRGDSSIQRGRPAPAHRHFGSATSRTRAKDATPNRLTTEGSRSDALVPSCHPPARAVSGNFQFPRGDCHAGLRGDRLRGGL